MSLGHAITKVGENRHLMYIIQSQLSKKKFKHIHINKKTKVNK